MSRVAAVLVLVFAGSFVLRLSLAFPLRLVDPDLAIRIASGNAEVGAAKAELLLRQGPDPSPAARRTAGHLASLALQREPVYAPAARTLAIARDLEGDRPGAQRLMRYTQNVSRRDLPSQLWFIEQAVGQNDVRGALHHYDIALRSSDASKPILFPVLVRALAQKDVALALADTIAASPSWGDMFVSRACQQATDFEGLNYFLRHLSAKGHRIPAADLAMAASRMVSAGRYPLAADTDALRQGGAATKGGDLTWKQQPPTPSPFSWNLANSGDLFAQIGNEGGHSVLNYRAASGSEGMIARRVMVLPVGAYTLSGAVRASLAPARIEVRCISDSRVLSSMAIPAAPTTLRAYSGTISIPPHCGAQLIQLVIETGDRPEDTTGSFSSLILRKGTVP